MLLVLFVVVAVCNSRIGIVMISTSIRIGTQQQDIFQAIPKGIDAARRGQSALLDQFLLRRVHGIVPH